MPPLLPTINACFNLASAICLILGFRAMKREEHKLHGKLMQTAFGFSAAFLVGYLYFHFFANAEERHFEGPGWMKPAYFTMLISHILLAVINLPLVILAMVRGRRHEREKHMGIARFAFPIWMYVSVTGVLIYLILYVWNPGGAS
jgi:putative membrane protein